MRLFVLIAAAAALVFGQPAPEILKKTAETYQSLKSYHFEAQVVSETVSDYNESKSRSIRISAATLPGLRRLESKGGQNSSLRVFDGKSVWEFRAGPKQYARQDQATYEPPRMNMLSDPVDNYKSLGKSEGATLLREETIDAAGGKRLCWVIEVPSRFKVSGMIIERSPTTYWVDKSSYLVLKEHYLMKTKSPMMESAQTQTSTTTYSVASANEAVPAELFRFQPPEGATEVAEFSSPFGGGSVMVGKTLPEFTLEDLAGKEVTSESLLGKPVLLNFWATWCAPCREQMPKIQELQRVFAEKGLVILAVNDGESSETARKYIEEHKYTFCVLVDRDKSLTRKFSVTGIPAVFMIERDGKVRAQYNGYSTSLDLGQELKKLGF